MQQNTNINTNQNNANREIKPASRELSYWLSFLQFNIAIIALIAYAQNIPTINVRISFTTGVRNIDSFYETNLVATVTNAIPVSIFFLKQNSTSPQINSVTDIPINRPIFAVKSPIKANNAITESDSTIIKQTIGRGNILSKNTYKYETNMPVRIPIAMIAKFYVIYN